MSEIASDIIGNIESYQQLLTTLSLGVAAGAFALLMQLVFHNAGTHRPISLRAPGLLVAGIIVQIVAIVFGVLTKSALVSSVSVLHQIQWGRGSVVKYMSEANLSHIQWCALAQVLSFVIGVCILLVVLFLNWKLIKIEEKR